MVAKISRSRQSDKTAEYHSKKLVDGGLEDQKNTDLARHFSPMIIPRTEVQTGDKMVRTWLTVIGISLFTIVINLPFGYWRANVEKFSKAWFLAVHLPVPFVVAARLGFRVSLCFIPVFLFSYFLGQWLGAKWSKARARRGLSPSSCLFVDLMKRPGQDQ